jgi:hypothetical protein
MTVVAFFSVEIPYPLLAPILSIMLYLSGASIPETSMQYDITTRWNVFALTLPTAIRKTVLAKFLLMSGMYSLCFLISVVMTAIFAFTNEVKFDILPLLTIFAFVVGFDSISYALVFRFGYRRGSAFKLLGVFAVPVLGVLYLFFGDLTVFGENGISDFLDWIIAFDFSALFEEICLPVVIFGIVSIGLCYWLSCKGYRAGIETGEE